MARKLPFDSVQIDNDVSDNRSGITIVCLYYWHRDFLEALNCCRIH